MKATKQIDIYLTRKRNVRTIDVGQYDTGIQLVFTVKDFTIPSGATATLYVQKPSGKFVYQEDKITVSGNTITIDLENQAITEHGKVPYQVSLKSGSDVITTFTGLMMVEKSLKDSGATESKTVIRAFDEAVSDHVAEFQTKAEQIVQACIATIPEDYTVMEAKVNELANAVKGYLSGAVVVADDVSPVEHNPVVKVRGKNLFNYGAWKGVNAIHGEVTYSDDGVVKLTATEDDCFTNYGMFPVAARIPVKPGEAVTISWETDADESMTSGLVYVFANGTADLFKSETATQKKLTYIAPLGCEFITFRLGVSLPGDSITYWNIQIEKGDIATAYEPYVDPSSVTVMRCGKNLLEPKNNNGAGYTATLNPDGSVKVTGSANTTNGIYLTLAVPSENNPLVLVKGQRYTVQAWSNNGRSILLKTKKRGGGDAWTSPTDFNRTGGTEYESIVQVYVESTGHAIGDTTLCGNYKFQLEVGETATEYEKYTSPTEHTPSADGTVPGVTSLSPNMTILTDTEGVVVECEYNRDTNKVIDKLINAITAMGGTV